ncbi:hypothetical protein AAY473_033578 [Plecturocebus cupreus]
MADTPPLTKLEHLKLSSDCCAGCKNFKPVDLTLLGYINRILPEEPPMCSRVRPSLTSLPAFMPPAAICFTCRQNNLFCLFSHFSEMEFVLLPRLECSGE